MAEGIQALTEKEKQTLRLVVRGHDAKSMARHLGLSVHTINERLRFARRKLEVSSSREAARVLLAREGGPANLLVPEEMGEAVTAPDVPTSDQPQDRKPAKRRFPWLIGGVVLMSLAIATMLFAALSGVALAPDQPAAAAVDAAQAAQGEAAQAALTWLALVDAGKWDESWDATGKSFKDLNTSAKWASVNDRVRTPLGSVTSRVFRSQESVPAPPYGYQMVKFDTSFATRPNVIETVTLEREGAAWRVVGYWLD